MKTQTLINRYYRKKKDSFRFTKAHQIELGRMLYNAHVYEVEDCKWGVWCKGLKEFSRGTAQRYKKIFIDNKPCLTDCKNRKDTPFANRSGILLKGEQK